MSPLTYAASLKPSNPDVLTYWDAMASANAPGFWQAMQDKISSLVAMNTWEPYPKAHALTSGHCILPGTWTFKRKRYPNVPSVNSRPATASAATSPTLRCSKTTAPPLLLPTALALPPGQSYCHQVSFFRYHVQKGDIKVVPISTPHQHADIFTKGLTKGPFEAIRKLLLSW